MEQGGRRRSSRVTPSSKKINQVNKLKVLFEKNNLTVEQLTDTDIAIQNTGIKELIPTNVKDIRSFFDRENVHDKLQNCRGHSTISPLKVATLNTRTVKASQGRKGRNNIQHKQSRSVQKSLKYTPTPIKGVAKPAKSANWKHHNSVNAEKTNKMSNINHDNSYATMSSDDEGNLTPMSGIDQLSQSQNEMVIEDAGANAIDEQLLQTITSSMAKIKTQKNANKIDKTGQRKRKKTASGQSVPNDEDIAKQDNIEANDQDNPTTMSITSVLLLMEKLRDDIRSDLSKNRLEDKKTMEEFKVICANEATKAASEVVEFYDQDLLKVRKELVHYKHRTEVLTEVCDRFQTQITDLEHRMENMEINSAKKMIIMTGFRANNLENKKDLSEELTDFFKVVLRVRVDIEEIFTLGSNYPRPIVMSFQNMQQKRAVMKNKTSLKNINKDTYGNVFINEYLPAASQEKKRREKEIISSLQPSEDTEEDQGIEHNFVKGNLYIRGEIYKCKVEPPTPSDLINMSVIELEKVLKMDTHKGPSVEQHRSKFTAHIASVKSHQQIRQIYKKMRLLHPEARHIVCAYWLEGGDTVYNQSFHDDQEPGAGRVLLKFLRENNLEGQVVFVARRYGGIRMGNDRFVCYQEAAKAAFGLNRAPSKTGPEAQNAATPNQNTPTARQQQQASNRHIPTAANKNNGQYSERRGRGNGYRGRGNYNPRKPYHSSRGNYANKNTTRYEHEQRQGTLTQQQPHHSTGDKSQRMQLKSPSPPNIRRYADVAATSSSYQNWVSTMKRSTHNTFNFAAPKSPPRWTNNQ